MPRWRIRLIVPEGPLGRHALKLALSDFQAHELRLEPRGTGTAEMTGDVIVDIREDGDLGDLLHALHEISPQVFISRVRPPGASASDQPIRVRALRRALAVP